jgi:hypothetical protein
MRGNYFSQELNGNLLTTYAMKGNHFSLIKKTNAPNYFMCVLSLDCVR